MRGLALIPAVGAIIIPYIAVIFANGGREPDNQRGFLEHRPQRTAVGRRPSPTPALKISAKSSSEYAKCAKPSSRGVRRVTAVNSWDSVEIRS